MRKNGWDFLVAEVSLFCNKNNIIVHCIDDEHVARGRSWHKVEDTTNLHHYRIELFYTVINMQHQELDNRFNEMIIELLLCMTCLNPKVSFSSFDKQKLLHLVQLYPLEFSTIDIMSLNNQLETYIREMCSSNEFLEVKGINNRAKKMVETKKNIVYQLVYLLKTLTLILPVATAIV